MNEIDFVKEKMILLNVENHQLINDKDNDLSNSAPLIIETISALRETFAGLGFNLYDHTQLLIHYTYLIRTVLKQHSA